MNPYREEHNCNESLQKIVCSSCRVCHIPCWLVRCTVCDKIVDASVGNLISKTCHDWLVAEKATEGP